MDAISEIDRLKIQLAKERQLRLKSEAAGLQMMQRQLVAAQQSVEAEATALFGALKATYALEPGDEIGEDGAIKRAPRDTKEG